MMITNPFVQAMMGDSANTSLGPNVNPAILPTGANGMPMGQPSAPGMPGMDPRQAQTLAMLLLSGGRPQGPAVAPAGPSIGQLAVPQQAPQQQPMPPQLLTQMLQQQQMGV